MAHYEVHIPERGPGPEGAAVTLRVDADHWMAALKAGIRRLGQQGTPVQNLLVDIVVQDDGSVHVTEPNGGRVFRIRELSASEVEEARPKPGTGGGTRLDPAVVLATTGEVSARAPMGGAGISTHAGPTPLAQLEARGAGMHEEPAGHTTSAPRDVVELERPTRPVDQPIGRPPSPRAAGDKQRTDDVLAEVFERVQAIYTQRTVEDALYFLLDLALERIPSESGSIYRADAGSGDLTFAAVRGPKAADLLKERPVLRAGTGISGFCVAEGVSLAVNDPQQHPKFYGAISDRLGYEVQSMIVSPMITHGRAFGCLQLINRRERGPFTDHDLGILAYLAHQGALFLHPRS